MTGLLLSELKQVRPFANAEVEAYLNLVRTADLLRRVVAEHLRQHDLTPAQYNVLRILRGATGPLCCSEITERLVTFEPDVTRLLDRLENAGLVTRTKDSHDGRIRRVHISERGLQMLDQLDEPIAQLHHQRLGRLNPERLDQLISALEDLRR